MGPEMEDNSDGDDPDTTSETKSNIKDSFKDEIMLKTPPQKPIINVTTKMLECFTCGLKCSKVSNLQTHMTRHVIPDGRHKCSVCDKSYDDEGVLKAHMRSHKLNFECVVCSDRFKDQCALDLHMFTHTGEHSHKCSICNRGFGRKGQMKKHLAKHYTSKDTFKSCLCFQCGKSFGNANMLNMHMVVHLKDKPFACDVCQMKFKTKVALEGHRFRIHSDNKKFNCNVCEKSFATTVLLKAHMVSHSTARSLQCPHCDKGFNYKQSLMSHIRTHTGEKSACKHCPKMFTQPHNLKAHVKKVHAEALMMDSANPEPTKKTLAGQKCMDEKGLRVKATNVEDVTSNDDNERTMIVTVDVQEPLPNPSIVLYEQDIKEVSDSWESITGLVNEEKSREDQPIEVKDCQKSEVDLGLKSTPLLSPDSKASTMEYFLQNHTESDESECKMDCKEETADPNLETDTDVDDFEDDGSEYKLAVTETEESEMDTDKEDVPIAVNEQEGPSTASLSKLTLATQASNKPIKCSVCDEQYSRELPLWKHMLSHDTPEGIHECHVCPKRFLELDVLRLHMRDHAKEPRFECPECDIKYWIEKDYQEHLLSHDNSCPVCNKNLSNKYNLKTHMLIHTGEILFKCSVCGINLSSEASRQRHILTKHETPDGAHECTVCKKRFLDKRVLKAHIKLHNSKEFKCSVCSKICQSANKLQCHQMIHTDEKPYGCSICEKTFSLKSYLKYHNARWHSGGLQYHCSVCSKKFASSRKLKEHMLIHATPEKAPLLERPHLCSTCGKGFEEESILKKHILLHDMEPSLQCKVCQGCFRSMTVLKEHVLNKHPSFSNNLLYDESAEKKALKRDSLTKQSSFDCVVCEKKFTNVLAMRQHMLTHSTPEGTHECHACGERYLEVGVLRLHMRNHSDVPTFKCSECFNTYWVNSELQEHLTRHDTTCSVCQKESKSVATLRVHMRTHSAELSFECSICNKRLTTQQKRKIHIMRSHEGSEGAYECTICAKRFTEEGILKLHLKTLHQKRRKDKDRPFLCTECGKSFPLRCQLEVHERVHKGELPFACSQCEKRFVSKLRLKEHTSRMHTEERQYQCCRCEKRFASRLTLKTHERNHEKERNHQCSICSKAFKRVPCLQRHMESHSKKPGVRVECPVCKRTFSSMQYIRKHMLTHTEGAVAKASSG